MNIKIFLRIFSVALIVMILLSIGGSIYQSSTTFTPEQYENLGRIFKIIFLLLFLIIAFALVPILPWAVINLFFYLSKTLVPQIPEHLKETQRKMYAWLWGNSSSIILNYIAEHKEAIIKIFSYSMWIMFLVGSIIAWPAFSKLLFEN